MREITAMQGSVKGAKRALPLFILLFVCGVLLNLVGRDVSSALGLPLYLDTIGTVIVAATGGYLPGIAVGFVTNVLSGISNSTFPYYSFVNILIAIFAALFANKGWLRNVLKVLLTTVVLALISGVLGTLITWLIGGMSLEFSPLGSRLIAGGISSVFLAECLAGVIYNFFDKLIAVIPAAIALRLVPEKLLALFESYGWRKSPLTGSTGEDQSICRRVSLRLKLLLIIAVSLILPCAAATVISSTLYHRGTIEEHVKTVAGISSLVAATIDPDMVDTYLEQGEAAPGYQTTEAQLYRIRESSPDIEYVYVYRIQPDGCHVVFDLDTEELVGSEPGDLVEFDESFSEYLPALLAGEEIEPLITDDTFGWLLTAYTPVRDANGNCQCYAAVDVSMQQLTSYDVAFASRVLFLFLGFFILVLASCFWLLEHFVTNPINTMARVTAAFAYDSEEKRRQSLESVHALRIRSGDEIEHLYQTFERNAETTVRYIEEVEKKGREISKLQNGLILVLADMVESRDQCTGDHVRKTAAYTKIIMDELRREGLFADVLTDEYIEDVVNSAPLHDVGKIHVPDALLNKPGKLTDEEFLQMQEHTSAGSEIISRAMTLVSDESGYLDEARNLAEYHHEKWDGSGYPMHLKGMDIPLSARIMAVADLFDALVSRRSYKKPFSIEDALGIIRDGMGTHFDPQVAQAFLNAEQEVRRIAEMNMKL